jgi:hypothetical protein
MRIEKGNTTQASQVRTNTKQGQNGEEALDFLAQAFDWASRKRGNSVLFSPTFLYSDRSPACTIVTAVENGWQD